MNTDLDRIRNDTIDMLKATIISYPGKLPLKKLNTEFRRCVGVDIPYQKLKYSNLRDFLESISSVKIENKREPVVSVLECNSMHIADLVARQKNRKMLQQYAKSVQNRRKKVNFKNVGYNSSNFQRTRSSSTGSGSTSGRSDLGSDGSSCQSNINIQIDPHRQMKVVCEPIAYHQQLIGDDFFLQLAIREVRVNNLWRKHDKSAIRSGLCVSGQTLRDCINSLSRIDTISNRLIIMLGAVDVYQNHSLSQMKKDFSELLYILENKFLLSKFAITICTIPPLVNIPLITDFERMSTLYGFNNYIRSLIKQNKNNDNYGFIDFFEEYNYVDEEYNHYTINFDLFQVEARMVSGCPNPHVLWNKKGRIKAMGLIRSASIYNQPGCNYYYR